MILPATAWRLWFGEGEFTEQWDPGSPWRDKRLRLDVAEKQDRPKETPVVVANRAEYDAALKEVSY